MRKLYNDIIGFVQQNVTVPFQGPGPAVKELPYQLNGHVRPALPPEGLASTRSREMFDPVVIDSARRNENVTQISAQIHINTESACVLPSGNTPITIPFAVPTLSSPTPELGQFSTRKAATLGFLDGSPKTQLNTIPAASADAVVTIVEDDRSPPKLFGVPLHRKKRLHPDSCNPDHETAAKHETLDALQTLTSSKGVKTDLALELKQPSMQAPWLKFCGSRNEKVYN